MSRFLTGLLPVMFLYALASGAFAQPAIQKPQRIALVVGNSDYNGDGDVKPGGGFARTIYADDLPGPCSNARLVADALKKKGFKVSENICDFKRDGIDGLFKAYTTQINALPDGSIVFIYYSGHGWQMYGWNYMVPTMADMTQLDPARNSLTTGPQVDAADQTGNNVVTFLKGVGKNRKVTIIVALDNCRNNPFFGTQAQKNGRVNELTDMYSGENTFIQYSTYPTQLAWDTGLYARTLTEQLTSGNDLADIMKQTRARFFAQLEAGGGQPMAAAIATRPDTNIGTWLSSRPAIYIDPDAKAAVPDDPRRVSGAGRADVQLSANRRGKNIRILWCDGDGEVSRRVYAQTLAERLDRDAATFGIGHIWIKDLPSAINDDRKQGYGNVRTNIMRFDDKQEAELLARIADTYVDVPFVPQKGVGITRKGDKKPTPTPSVSVFVCGKVPPATDEVAGAFLRR